MTEEVTNKECMYCYVKHVGKRIYFENYEYFGPYYHVLSIHCPNCGHYEYKQPCPCDTCTLAREAYVESHKELVRIEQENCKAGKDLLKSLKETKPT